MLRRVQEAFVEALQVGVIEQTRSSLPSLDTYIQRLPDGRSNNGIYLVADLGGTNFRVALVQLEEHKVQLFRNRSKQWQVSEAERTGSSDRLFDFLAQSIKSCMSDWKDDFDMNQSELSMGITFSYALNQTSPSDGVLLGWSKDYTCNDAIGKNVSDLLHAALIRQGLQHVRIKALINDSVSALLAQRHCDESAMAGVIVGTGTNAAIVNPTAPNLQRLVINLEWGGFGDDGSMDQFRSIHDRMVDEESSNPGHQLFEKMVSGMYLSRVAAKMLADLIGSSNNNNNNSALSITTTDMMQHFASGPSANFDESYCHTPSSSIVRFVSKRLVWRSAALLGAAIAAIFQFVHQHTGKEHMSVALDGSMCTRNPTYVESISKIVQHLIGPNNSVVLDVLENASIYGAAVALALNNNNQ